MSRGFRITKLSDVIMVEDIESAHDRGRFVSALTMRSGWFSYNGPFFFDSVGLRGFVKSLEQMNMSLRGEARLTDDFNHGHIALRCTPLGHVVVSGEFNDDRHGHAKLNFFDRPNGAHAIHRRCEVCDVSVQLEA